MTSYHNFIGIDIGKFNFVVAVNNAKSSKEYPNSDEGIAEFINDHHDLLANSLSVLETTGGYELVLLYTLCSNNFPVHRANTKKVKNFIRSFGNAAKTDNLDAKALARYGAERHPHLDLFTPQSQQSLELFALVQRRSDLKQMLVAEKNRLQQASKNKNIKASCARIIEAIDEDLSSIDEQINAIFVSDPILRQKQEVLKTIPGIGDIVSFQLLVLLPELGNISRRQIASLVGVAPLSNDSGSLKGYRHIAKGRETVKPILFLAAMAARRSSTALKMFYEKLVNKGKKKMVALVALMRKIIVIANAKLRDLALGELKLA